MSSVRLAFSSRRGSGRGDVGRKPPAHGRFVALSSLPEGSRATVVEVSTDPEDRADRLLALGVTPGVSVVVLQTFPGVVVLCDQTELAFERGVAAAIFVSVQETRP